MYSTSCYTLESNKISFETHILSNHDVLSIKIFKGSNNDKSKLPEILLFRSEINICNILYYYFKK